MSKYWQPITNDPVSSSQFRSFADEIEDSAEYTIGNGILSGLTLTGNSGLQITISAGRAFFGGGQFFFAGDSLTIANGSTNHIYLTSAFNTPSRTYYATLTSNTTGTPPADSVKLGTVTTSGGSVTGSDFTSTGGRSTTITPLVDLSLLVGTISNPNYFLISSTGLLINYINNALISGSTYLTKFDFNSVSGSWLTRTEYAGTSGSSFAAVSGNYALKIELSSTSGSLDARIDILEAGTGSYITQNQFNSLSGQVASLLSGGYIPWSASGLFATSGRVRNVELSLANYLTIYQFAQLSGSAFASSSGQYASSAQIAALSGQIQNILNTYVTQVQLASVTGAILKVSRLNGLSGTVTLISSGSITVAVSGQSIIIHSTSGSGGSGYNGPLVTSIHSLSGGVGLVPSGGITLATSGNNIIIYSATGSGGIPSESDPIFASLSGSFLSASQYAATSGNIPSSGFVHRINSLSGNVTFVASGATTIGVSGNNVLIHTSSSSVESDPVFGAASGNFVTQAQVNNATGTIFSIPLLFSYTPPTTGTDTARFVIPYNHLNGTSFSLTLKRITLMAPNSGSVNLSITVYKASSGSPNSFSSIGSISLTAGSFITVQTTGLGTVISSNILSLHVTETDSLLAPSQASLITEFST